MKLTMLGIFTVLLVATLAAPAAAATLASGSYIADVIAVGGTATLNTICGRAVVSAIAPFSLVFSVDYQAISVTGCNTGVGTGTLAVPARFDLCRRDENNNKQFVKTIEDTNINGKIDGMEGILKGLVGSGNTVTTFELYDHHTGGCGGDPLFRTGYRQPS